MSKEKWWTCGRRAGHSSQGHRCESQNGSQELSGSGWTLGAMQEARFRLVVVHARKARASAQYGATNNVLPLSSVHPANVQSPHTRDVTAGRSMVVACHPFHRVTLAVPFEGGWRRPCCRQRDQPPLCLPSAAQPGSRVWLLIHAAAMLGGWKR